MAAKLESDDLCVSLKKPIKTIKRSQTRNKALQSQDVSVKLSCLKCEGQGVAVIPQQ